MTRIQNWLDRNPVEQTIDVPGIAEPVKSKTAVMLLTLLYVDLLVAPDGGFAITVATGHWANNGQRGGTTDHIVSVIDLRTFQVLTTVHQSGILEYFTDPPGRLVTRETADPNGSPIVRNQTRTRGTTLKFFTLPELAPAGSCQFTETLQNGTWVPNDQGCRPSLQATLDSSPALPYRGTACSNWPTSTTSIGTGWTNTSRPS